MSNSFVERFCHKNFQKNPKKSKEEIIKSLTHLYLNGRKLDEIGELSCDRLKVLYLHNNSIYKITNLSNLVRLTHLYLQWNCIRKIENLSDLKHLRKLYLSFNEIQYLEGVENLIHLEELHVEYQNLRPEQPFTFDRNSLNGISLSLRTLNVSGLKLDDLEFLGSLPNLRELIASGNNFSSSDYIASSISHLKYLKICNFTGCPAQKNDFYYRNKIIMASKSLGNFFQSSQIQIDQHLSNLWFNGVLEKYKHFYFTEILDNTIINEVTRTFLKSFDRIKTEQKQKQSKANDELDILINAVGIDLQEELLYSHNICLPNFSKRNNYA